MDRCLVRYLGPPPEQIRRPGSPTAAAEAAAEPIEEVEASSLVKFPGGQSLVATGWEVLAPLPDEELPKDFKGARDEHIRREFLLPANEGRKVTMRFATLQTQAKVYSLFVWAKCDAIKVSTHVLEYGGGLRHFFRAVGPAGCVGEASVFAQDMLLPWLPPRYGDGAQCACCEGNNECVRYVCRSM